MSSLLYTLYSAIYLALFAWGGLLLFRFHRFSTLLLLLVIAGLFYDNLILSIGNRVGEGERLRALSLPRFWLHQLVLPWIILAAFLQARQAGLAWAHSPAGGWVAVALSAGVMILGILTRLVGLRLEPVVLDGVLRYVAAGVHGPPLVSILSIGLVGVIGLLLWAQHGFPWLFLIVVVVFVIEGFPNEALRRAAGSAVEALLMGVLLWIETW